MIMTYTSCTLCSRHLVFKIWKKKIFELTCPVKVLSARWATLETDAQLRDRQDLNKQRPTTLIPTPLNAVVNISMISSKWQKFCANSVFFVFQLVMFCNLSICRRKISVEQSRNLSIKESFITTDLATLVFRGYFGGKLRRSSINEVRQYLKKRYIYVASTLAYLWNNKKNQGLYESLAMPNGKTRQGPFFYDSKL